MLFSIISLILLCFPFPPQSRSLDWRCFQCSLSFCHRKKNKRIYFCCNCEIHCKKNQAITVICWKGEYYSNWLMLTYLKSDSPDFEFWLHVYHSCLWPLKTSLTSLNLRFTIFKTCGWLIFLSYGKCEFKKRLVYKIV